MMKRIYVSSTTPDLAQHRTHLVRILAENKYRVLNESGLNTLDSLESIVDADVFVGIVGHHYGDPSTSEKSIFELQFDEAVALELPTLMFLVNPDYIWDDAAYETSPQGFQRRKQFENRILSRFDVDYHLFTSPEDLATQILDELKKKQATGSGRFLAAVLLSSILLLAIGISVFLFNGGNFPFVNRADATLVGEATTLTPTLLSTTALATDAPNSPSATPIGGASEATATKRPFITPLPQAAATERATNGDQQLIVEQPTKSVSAQATTFEAQGLNLTPTLIAQVASATPFVPTATVMPTLSPTFTITATTATKATSVPPTFTVTPATTATVEASTGTEIIQTEPCTRPQGWADYTIQRGNTLFSIARSVSSTVRILAEVNCLADADAITSGQVIFIPFLPSQPIQTTTPSATGSSTNNNVVAVPLSGGVCPSANVSITSPGSGATLSGTFTVYGTARQNGEPFQYYRLEIRPAFSEVYNFVDSKPVQVVNGVLGSINAKRFGNGAHYLRLTVVNNTGNYPDECIIPIVFSGN